MSANIPKHTKTEQEKANMANDINILEDVICSICEERAFKHHDSNLTFKFDKYIYKLVNEMNELTDKLLYK